jgi:hypothetical protein
MFKEIHLEFHNRIILFDEYRDNPEPIVFYFSGQTPVELNHLKLSFSDSCQKIIYYFETGSIYPKIIPSEGDVPTGVKSVIYCHKGGFDIFFRLPGSFIDSNKHHEAVVYFNGFNLKSLVRSIVETLLSLTGRKTRFIEQKPKVPKWFQTLGWASMMAYGTDVSHEKVMNAVWSLKQQGYTPGYVLLENGWQHEENGVLIDFGAHPQKFPSGLKGLVQELQAAGVKNLGVWHPMTGAGSGGLSETLAKKYLATQSCDCEVELSLGNNLGRAFEFFQDFYRTLREEGVSFVQIGESPHDHILPSNYEKLQCAIEASAVIHFDCPPINADGLNNENPLFWPISPIARVADVTIPSSLEAIQTQIRDNLLNATFYQDLVLPDFGPWCTKSIYSEMQSLFHALSRTTHLLGDPPGEHQKLLLKKIALPSGKVLQADISPSVCASSLLAQAENDKEIFKVCTITRGCGALALFNLSNAKRSLKGLISLSDFEKLVGNHFAVYSHRHGFVGLIQNEEQLEVSLKPDSCDLLLFCPIVKGVSVVGFHDFYLAPAPILQIDVEDQAVHITAKIIGPLLLYSEKEVLEVRRNGLAVSWEYDKERKMLSVEPTSNIIESHSAYTILFES